MSELCAYCGLNPALSEAMPLCASCAERWKSDPDFANQVAAHFSTNARKSIERLTGQLREWHRLGRVPKTDK